MPGGPLGFMRLIRVGILQRVAQLIVRVLPTSIRVPLGRGSSSHGGERKGQLGPAVTVPMSGTHLKRDEGWDPTILLLDTFYVF